MFHVIFVQEQRVQAVLVAGLFLLYKYDLEARAAKLGLFRSLSSLNLDHCTAVDGMLGPEDVQVGPGRGLSSLRWGSVVANFQP